jgi:ABC-2 type transport system ATP-binding protein
VLRRRAAAAQVRHGTGLRPRTACPGRADHRDGRRGAAQLLGVDPQDAEQGRTVLFATHYLEEADAYADRIILLRHGQKIADGTASEIKAMSAGRTVRVTMAEASEAELRAIPGADSVEIRGETVLIHANDSDAVARYLLTRTSARDLEITARGIEDAFLALTGDDAEPGSVNTGAIG